MSRNKHSLNRTTLPKALLFPGLMFLLSPFVYTEQVLDPVMVPRILFFAVFTIGILVYLIVLQKKTKLNTSILSHTFAIIYLGFVILSGVSVIISVNTGEGVWEFLKLVLFFVIFTSGILFLSEEQGLERIMPKIVIVFSFVILSIGIYQLVGVLQAGPLDHQTSYLVNSVLAHRNLFSQMLFLTIPFLMMGIYFLRSFWRVASVVLIIFSLVMITLLLVKSVWFALVVSSLVSFMLILFFRKKFGFSALQFKRLLVYSFGAILVILISVAVYSRFNSIETFEKQTYVLKNYKFGSAIERVHLWEKSIEMFRDHPVIGIGKGNWRIYLPDYGTSGLRSSEGEIIYQRPHNDFLWVLAENGIITFVFYILMFLVMLKYLVEIIRKSAEMRDRYFALFLIFFVTGYIVVASFSFPLERPVHSLLLNLVFILTVVKYDQILPAKQHVKPPVFITLSIVAIVLLSITIYAGIYRFKGEHHTRNALTYRADGKWEQTIDEIEKAESWFMKLDPTATPLRWYSGLSWYNIGQMDHAFEDFKAAFKANPYHMHVLNNLATIYGLDGKNEEAIKYYKEAMRISPHFVDAPLNLCVIYFNMKQIDSAYAVLRQVEGGAINPNYRNVVTALVYEKVENLKNEVDDRDLYVTLTRIRNSKDWMVKVHEQAINDEIPLERHLIIESIYMLETVDQTIDSTRAAYLREKYLNKKE